MVVTEVAGFPAETMLGWGEHELFMALKKERRLPRCFYRVETRVVPARKTKKQMAPVGVTPYGFTDSVDLGHTVIYDNVDSLPEWMREKLAVLVTLRFDVPTEELVGLGRRVSEHVFWVYARGNETLGEVGGSDTGAKGKSRRKKTT